MSTEQVSDDPNGRVLAGRYRLVEQLGRGGMGVVYRAVDQVLAREVAVKELRVFSDASAAELAELRIRMQREARAAARIRHPGVISVYDVAEEAGRPVIVMELVTGPSLDDALRERGALDPHEAAGIGAQVADALAAAHAAGVLHRDVKPGNILLERGGRVVLTDFGIATMDDPGDGTATRLTQSGELVGSLDFFAPERAQGEEPGPASDVWSLGAMLFAAVEGAAPFRRTTTWSTMTAIVSEPTPEPRRAGPLAPALRALLAKDPAQRPDARSAHHLLAAVASGRAVDPQAMGGQPFSAGPVAGPQGAPVAGYGGPQAPLPPQPPQSAWTPAPPPYAEVDSMAGTRRIPGWQPPVGLATPVGPEAGAASAEGSGDGRRRRVVLTAAVAAVVLVGGGVAWAVEQSGAPGAVRAGASESAVPGAPSATDGSPTDSPTGSAAPGRRPSSSKGHAASGGKSPTAGASTGGSGGTDGSGGTGGSGGGSGTGGGSVPTHAPAPTHTATSAPKPPWASCTYYSGTAQQVEGDTGAPVKELQCILVDRGYSVGAGGVDGQFGPDTLAAVKKFQTAKGLEVDGQVGPLTWAALRSSS